MNESASLAAQILAMNEELSSLLELPGKVNELLLLKPSIDLMKASVEEVQTSISFLAEKYDNLLAKVSTHATDIHDLRAEVGALKTTVSEQAQTIQSLHTEMNDAEQRSRLQDMEIHGLSVTSGESLSSILVGLADKLGIEGHQPSDVVSIYRLQGKRA
ncbi:hypothetical protein HPB47_014253, partial [Ixodes persulcatus]